MVLFNINVVNDKKIGREVFDIYKIFRQINNVIPCIYKKE